MQLCKWNAMCKIKCTMSKQFLHNKKTHFQPKISKNNMDNKKKSSMNKDWKNKFHFLSLASKLEFGQCLPQLQKTKEGSTNLKQEEQE